MPASNTLPSDERMAQLLAPYLHSMQTPPDLMARCRVYLDLLLRWNEKTNLTAVRDPETLVQRQLGESLFAARLLDHVGSLLDFGSGAGFPGIPLQLALPGLVVTLAESQGKKASFLREAVRTLGLQTTVWSGRVEAMPATCRYDCVALRAVDGGVAMLDTAEDMVAQGGCLLRFVARGEAIDRQGWASTEDLALPNAGRVVLLHRR